MDLKEMYGEIRQPLPVGKTEWNEWAERIIAKAGNFADRESMEFALASQVIHLAHDKAFVEDSFFVNCLRKAAANQVASQVFYDIKIKQEADRAAKQAADTASLTPLASETVNASSQETKV